MVNGFISDIAREVQSNIENAGWTISVERIAAKPGAARNDSDLAGVVVSAVKAAEPSETFQARAQDWSNERAELEAVCLLAHRLGVQIVADDDQQFVGIAA